MLQIALCSAAKQSEARLVTSCRCRKCARCRVHKAAYCNQAIGAVRWRRPKCALHTCCGAQWHAWACYLLY